VSRSTSSKQKRPGTRIAPYLYRTSLTCPLSWRTSYAIIVQQTQTEANIHGGVFGATLNDQGSLNNKKRSRDNGEQSKPCICGDNHFWNQCLYIDTALRTRGFVEDPEKAKKVALFEAADTEGILNKIREKNRRYKKQKSKDADKRAESDSIEIDAGDAPADQPLHEANAGFSSAFNN
jgi:hypothetical protein